MESLGLAVLSCSLRLLLYSGSISCNAAGKTQDNASLDARDTEASWGASEARGRLNRYGRTYVSKVHDFVIRDWDDLTRKETLALKDIASKHDEALQWEEHRNGNCVNTAKRRVQRDVDGDQLRQRRYVYTRHETAKFGTAVYFPGDSALVLKAPTPPVGAGTPQKVIPRSTFTFEVWLKPEGGQIVGVPIVTLHDDCGKSSLTRDRGWALGIGIPESDENQEQGARFYFSLRTERSREKTRIWSHVLYKPAKWVHVAVLYDGRRLQLYINSAKVATGHSQRGDIFSESRRSCIRVTLGGNVTSGAYFRGAMDELRFWDFPVKHREIVSSMYHTILRDTGINGLFLRDNFDNMNHWDLSGTTAPAIVASDIPFQPNDMTLVAPPCGETVCDDPDVTRSYTNNWEMRRPKTIRYRLINVMNSDGSHPTVSSDQIDTQHRALNRAFRPFNITFDLTEMSIRNTSLRQRTILFGCDPDKVGNDACNPACRHPRTGEDGGDCDITMTPCDPSKFQNGHCDPDCNKKYHGWDGGDCCQPNDPDVYQQCFDPSSNLRGYLSIDEYKTLLNVDSVGHLNVFFADWTMEELQGVATFPWEKTVHGILGGTVVQPEMFGIPGKTDSLVHEFGHNLGLWHVHHGISEMTCSDPCLESRPSLELGDLCEDTGPTPQNGLCKDPGPVATDVCGVSVFDNTPYKNYMGYTSDACTDRFSPNQVARMHCYLDLSYQSWRQAKSPSPPPLAPKVISTSAHSLTLAWIPPLGNGASGMDDVCALCQEDKSLVQFAASASSPNPSKHVTSWAPHQATGAPDAEVMCEASTRTWLPNVRYCNNDCYIVLGFQHAVVPSSITIWVSWGTSDGIEDVELVFTDGTELKLGPITAFCDMPYTRRLMVAKPVEKVRIFIKTPYVAIDAVQLTSTPDHAMCATCRKLKYRVTRAPPFSGIHVITESPQILDNDVSEGSSYTYHVQAVLGTKMSDPSPVLSVVHGQPYCGNGIVESTLGEACDDGNALNGDGCTLECKVESFFHCSGEPSLCYLHDGDGICENFERRYSIHDCGFFTPEGFTDQWATGAIANPEFQSPECPESVVIGQPHLMQECKPSIDPKRAWSPCGHYHQDDNFWLKATFRKAAIAVAVIIHLAADGTSQFNPIPTTLSVELIDDIGKSHQIGAKDVRLHCKDNPIMVNVLQDLSKPFFRAKGVLIRFRSFHIAISGVALRSYKYLDPITIKGCQDNELFNPQTGSCVAYANCKRPLCGLYAVKHGEARCTGQEDGDVCTISCDQGFILDPINQNEVVCDNGAWAGPGIICRPINCGQPDILYASAICPDGTTYGKQCTFRCNQPATMRGTGNIIRCDADGLWSLADATCHVMCVVPPLLPNAALVTRYCRDGNQEVGTRCKFKCNIGYHILGESARRKVGRVHCNEAGSWDGPPCTKITCPSQDTLYKGLYNCTDAFYPGSICTLLCPGIDQTTSQITCLGTGEWDAEFQPCDFTGMTCPQPTSTPHIVLSCPSTNVGSKCQATCVEPHNDVTMSSAYATTLQNPRTNRKMAETMCTGQRTWTPEPGALHCIEECRKNFIGDGWCDAKNNREYCSWDAGDCCRSTVRGGMVQPFPASCTDECRCKDPNAIENRAMLRKFIRTNRLG
ncbi:pappalysin-1-like [Lineus longissimus]|uniref:pappalysin-1-like n=1 Tax=Lineus longissimus TaxID=88925 RepID=UPI002B4E2B1F